MIKGLCQITLDLSWSNYTVWGKGIFSHGSMADLVDAWFLWEPSLTVKISLSEHHKNTPSTLNIKSDAKKIIQITQVIVIFHVKRF